MNKTMKKIQEFISKRPFTAIGGTLIIGMLLGWLLFGGSTDVNNLSENTVDEHEHEAGTTYTCSMHPQVRQGEAGSCPICGMDLIPLAKNDGGDLSSDEVVLSVSAMKIAEVETSIIEKKNTFQGSIITRKGESR